MTSAARVEARLPPGFWPAVYNVTMGGEWPPQTRASTDLFIKRCAWHRLLPLLSVEADTLPGFAHAIGSVRMLDRAFAVESARRYAAVTTVCGIFQDEPIILLKGADYGARLYSQAHLRPIGDIDILVRADRFDAVCERGLRSGFVPVAKAVQGTMLSPTHNEREYEFDGQIVDLHQSFVHVPRHRIDYDGIWRRRVPTNSGCDHVARLEAVDALVYHALTMGFDDFRLRLIRFVDFWLLLNQYEGIASVAAARARDWQAARALFGALSLACRLFPAFRTADVIGAMEHLVSRFERRLVERWILPVAADLRKSSPPNRSLQLWRKTFLLDSWARRLAFAAHYISQAAYPWAARSSGDARVGEEESRR